MNAAVIVLGLILAIVLCASFVWACKLLVETVSAALWAFECVARGAWYIARALGRLAWRIVRIVLRLVCRVLLPLLGWLLEHVCIYTGLAWLYLSHRAKRAYIEREIKARSK